VLLAVLGDAGWCGELGSGMSGDCVCTVGRVGRGELISKGNPRIRWATELGVMGL